MKRYVLFVLFAFSLLFTSCIEILENIILKKDGTGAYTLTLDMSKLMQDEFMAGMLKKVEGEDKKEITEADTTIYGRDLSAEEKGTDADIWNRMSMRTVASEKDKKLVASFMLDFENLSEISFLMKNIDKLGSKAKKPGDSTSSDTPPTDMLIPSNVNYELKKNELVRTTTEIKKPDEENKDENAAMMKMFLGDATYKVTYEMPNRVKKTTIEGAKIKGNIIFTEMKLLDLMDNGRKLDGSIRF